MEDGAAAAPVAEPQAPVGPQEFNHTFPKGALGMSIGIKADQVVVNEITSSFGAAKSKGVEAGDVVLEINGKSFGGSSLDPLALKAELKLRPLRLKLRREGAGAAADTNEETRTVSSGSSASTAGAPAAPSAGPAAAAKAIEERVDPSTGVQYFFDPATGKSAWTREELDPEGAKQADGGDDDDSSDEEDDDEVGEMPETQVKVQRGRGLSVMSTQALDKLQGFEAKFAKLQAETNDIEEAMEGKGSTPIRYREQVGKFQADMAQINGHLEKLQFTGVDGVVTQELNSGKEQARTQRKGLNKQCEELRERLQTLKPKLDAKKASLPPDPTTPEFKRSLTTEGWLLKKGHSRTNWNKRWFIMDLDAATLRYYPNKPKKKKMPKAKGEMTLDASSVFETPTYKKDKYENFFTVSASNGESKLEMRAADAAGLEAWKKTLEHTISTLKSN